MHACMRVRAPAYRLGLECQPSPARAWLSVCVVCVVCRDSLLWVGGWWGDRGDGKGWLVITAALSPLSGVDRGGTVLVGGRKQAPIDTATDTTDNSLLHLHFHPHLPPMQSPALCSFYDSQHRETVSKHTSYLQPAGPISVPPRLTG